MYDELVKQLRDNAEFLLKASSGCLSNSFADTMGQAADAIEELQTTLCNWCAVCPRDKRDLSTCEIYESCRAKPPKGGKMNGCEFCGYANRTVGKTLHIVETEPRIFINMHGSGYIQIFDEDYPGFVDGFYVNHCPMCGARLRSGYVGGEPPKEAADGKTAL